jgi:hypothetical protein
MMKIETTTMSTSAFFESRAATATRAMTKPSSFKAKSKRQRLPNQRWEQVCEGRTNVDSPPLTLARSSSKKPNVKASKSKAKVSHAFPNNADNDEGGMLSFSTELVPQDRNEVGKDHPVLVRIWRSWLDFIPDFEGKQTVDGSSYDW